MSGLTQNDLESGQNSSGEAPAGLCPTCPIKKFYLERMAVVVAQRGLEFEKRLATETETEREERFSFLWSSDPYHEYYKYKVCEAQKNRLDAPSHPHGEAPSDPKFPKFQPADPRMEEWITYEPEDLLPNGLPPGPYIIRLTQEITRKEIYTIKLTAQLVARHGMKLIKSRNLDSRFEFMNPTDSKFKYFERLVAAYSEDMDSNAPTACTATVLEDFFRRLERDPLQEMEAQKNGVVKFQEWLLKYGKPELLEAALVDETELDLLYELVFLSLKKPQEPEPKRHKQGSFTIVVSIPNGRSFEVTVESSSENVASLKDKVAEEIRLPAKMLRLRGTAGFLEDNMSLAEYNLGAGDILTLSL